MRLLPPEAPPQPLAREGRAGQPPRGQGPGQQDVAPLVVDLHHQLLAARPDLYLLFFREGQPDVQRVAAAFLLDLDRLLAEEDRGGGGVAEDRAAGLLGQRQPPPPPGGEARPEARPGVLAPAGPPPGPAPAPAT